MIKKIKALFFISMLVLACVSIHAQVQQGNALFEHLTTENGISNNEVTCIFQDSRGFIWIGTANGLNRYDGVEIVQYFHTNNSNSITGNRIYSIREDKLHNLWVGTDEGVSYFEAHKNKFTNYLHTPAEIEKLKASQFNISIDSHDDLWVTSNFHLSFFDKEKKQFIHYKIDNGETLPVTRNYNVRSAFEDSKKRLWLPTSYGVKLFNQNTKQFTSFHFSEKEKALPENFVVAVKETGSKKIIASTWGGSILIYNEEKMLFEKMILFEKPMPRTNYINIVLDILPANEKLYCATSEGLVIINEKEITPGVCKNFTVYSHSDNNSKSISSNFTSSLILDKAGTLWIAAKGISKIDPLKQVFQNTFLSYNKVNRNISGISFLPNNIILGAQDAYFFNDGELKPINLSSKIKSDFGEQVWDVCTGKFFIWLATTNGLIQTTKEGKFVKQYLHQKNNAATIAGERIWKVYEDSKGLVWLGSVRKGISIINPETGSIKNYFGEQGTENNLFNAYINDFFEDKEGNVWFAGGNDKLYCYNRSLQNFSVTDVIIPNTTKISSTPVIIKKQSNGSLILASQKGILQFQPSTKEIKVVAFHPDMSVVKHAIAEGNNYWMVTGNGLLYFNSTTKLFKRYTTQNGLPTNEDIDVIKLMPDGNIILGGAGFISIFNPKELGNNKNIPPVHIIEVLANSSDTLYAFNKNKLPHLSGIEFHFAALGFSNATQNMYKYRLVGIDNNWSQPTTQRSISYAQLPPGDYTFEVIGSNADGLWNENPAVFVFSIKRPFYKAWWFYVLLVVITAALLYSFYRYRLRQAIELEKMRTRIATDLHDDIGATLSSISMYSDALSKQVKENMPHLESVLNKMGENSREMVAGISDIVWAVNPENDSGEKLLQRMESYATDMCAVKNIQLHFEVDKKIKQVPFLPEKRKNIYLIFKEAINNAVKYSQAKNIWVTIKTDNLLTVTVKDDGIGFYKEAIKKGNGLKNFKLRADEIKGIVEVDSSNGTLITLTCSV